MLLAKKISSFLDKRTMRLKDIVAVELVDVKVEKFPCSYCVTHKEFTFASNKFIMTGLQVESPENVYLTYFHEGVSIRCLVPNFFKVKKLSVNAAKDLFAAYEKYNLDNLHLELKHNFTIGSDPEIFVEDENGAIIPAFTFLGSKAEKKDTTARKNHGGLPMYWDGFQAEFETHVGTCLGWQVDSVQAGLEGVINAARKVNPKAKLSAKTVADIPLELLQNSKEEHVQFGCMPSFNVYGIKTEMQHGRDVAYRSTGGHIHFGIGKKSKKQISAIVKTLDAILGVACVALFAKHDSGKRRQMYGLAGEYRLPKHGLEYRTLSNAWILHPFIMHLVFDLSRKVLVFGEKGMLKHWNGSEQETIKVINKCDVDGAKKILERNKEMFIKLLKAAYPALTAPALEKLYLVFLNGMETAIKDPTAIETNWGVDGGWVTHTAGKEKCVNHQYDVILKDEKVA